MLCLIQFSAVLLSVNRDLNGDAVLRSRRRRIQILTMAIQSLCLDDRGKVLVADIKIDVAVDACDLALLGMLPDAVCAAVVRLVNPVRQPDGIAALDVIGGVRHERGPSLLLLVIGEGEDLLNGRAKELCDIHSQFQRGIILSLFQPDDRFAPDAG